MTPLAPSRLFPLVLLALTTGLGAQTVEAALADGTTLHGKPVGAYRLVLRIETANGIHRDLPWENLASVSGGPVSLGLGEGEAIQVTLEGVAAGRLQVRHALLGSLTVPLAALPQAPPLPAPTQAAGDDELAKEVQAALEPKPWNGHVSLGASLSAGNSDVFTATLDALLQRDWENDHLEFRAFAVYGTAEGEVNQNSQLVGALWRHFYDPDFYAYISTEASRDEIQDRKFRGLVNVGAGIVLWKDSDKELFSLEGGVGYRLETFTGNTPTRNDVTGRAAALYKDIFFDDVEFTQTAELIVPFTDPNSFIGRSESILSVPISESWSFRTSLRLEYNNDPAGGRDNLDILTTLGLEYSF